MAEKKMTTLNQLKKLAVRTRADAVGRIAELAELVAACLEDAQHVGITVTLPAANWSGGTQVVSSQSLLADSNYWYIVCSGGDVKADDITTNGQMTFRCDTTPESDLTVNILRLEVIV